VGCELPGAPDPRDLGAPLGPSDCALDVRVPAERERDGCWVYRRNEKVTQPIKEIGGVRDGVPFLRPEIALLYKSTDDSPKNASDLDVVLPSLDADARSWLAEALAACDRHHSWLAKL
jgi:hypothetical protein